MSAPAGWEIVVGLEVHAQLLTKTKAFCGCANRFGDPPNVNTCPVCLGLPGALPVLNAEAVRMALTAALALGCEIQRSSVFSRKNYFYPDLPKGYQISQYDLPLALRGLLEIEVEHGKRAIRITRVHMEEDAGKNLHGHGDESIVDLNRAGTPLIEIVGEPDLRSGAEAAEYLRRLREILMFIGVNDGSLEQGSFRCDANVSVRRAGATELGTRAELKNINSFKFVGDAIDIEARRQIAELDAGRRVRQQTRGYNADKRESYLLRDKENEAGYRYFPEPDLPPLVVDEALLARVSAELPPLPAERRRFFVEQGVAPAAAAVLTSHPRIARFAEQAVRLHKDAVKVANFIQAEVLRDVTTAGLDAAFPVTPAQLGEILGLVDEGKISGKQAKELYAAVARTDLSPAAVARERGIMVMSDERAIEALAREIVGANAKQADAYRAGKTALLGFFVGQIMKRTGGSASPAVVNAALARVLGGDVPKPDLALPPPPPPRAPQQPAPSAAPPSSAQSTLEPQPSEADRPQAVPFEAFGKLDIRVGIITKAARVPKKDKLLDLELDTGDPAPRRVVAGLALSFAPDALIGKRVLVVVNLEARAFSKDLISHGMILAAGPSDALVLATVTGDVPAGTRIK